MRTVLIVIVLLAALGGGGWFAWKYFSRPDVTVTPVPQKIHVAAGGKTLLEAGVSGSRDTDVTWSIQEGDKGGQITPLGIQMDSNQPRSAATYTAPVTGGTFHVIATSHANPSRKATVEIVVGATEEPDTSAAAASPTATAPAAAATPAAAPVTGSPAPPTSLSANPNAAQIVGTWRWPSGETMTIGADGTVAVNSQTDPSKNKQGAYRFTDNSHLQVDFGSGDVRTWEIVGVDSNYWRVLAQSHTDNSPTAMVFAKLGS